jgi:hypothetical protein
MKKYFASVLFAVVSLIGLGVSAVGQEQKVIVAVPFSFVAAGKILPAGEYTVSRLSHDGLEELRISSFENRAGVLVLANHFDSHSANSPKVTFEQVGDVHYLRTIESSEGVYTIDLPRTINLLVASTKQHGSMSPSGTN